MRKATLVIVFCLLSLSLALAQSGNAVQTSPIVGTWNQTATNPDGTIAYIGVETFNLGGTMIHIDTDGTNSSGSPGESIDLGTWKVNPDHSFHYKFENYTYNASGKLVALGVAKCDANLATPPKAFTGSCKINFYTCSLDQCPGSFLGGPFDVQIAARRF